MRIGFVYQQHQHDQLARGIPIALALERLERSADILLLVQGEGLAASAWNAGGPELAGSPIRIVSLAPAKRRLRLPWALRESGENLGSLIAANERLLRSCDIIARHRDGASMVIHTRRQRGDGTIGGLVRNLMSFGFMVDVDDASIEDQGDIGGDTERLAVASKQVPFRIPTDQVARLMLELARGH